LRASFTRSYWPHTRRAHHGGGPIAGLCELDQEVRSLDGQVQELDAEVSRWRAENEELMQGLGVAIDEQFDRWKLSGAEAEVALLLLKGLSLKEVAQVRGTSERTSRDQARAVYKKSDLAGRSELSAFFLEDLLLPTSQQDAA
jgi:DNA-binding CsgD family transcriptional regulator